MAFSTGRKYSGSHAMTPSVEASRGAGSAPSSGGSVSTTGSGSKANDTAALAGMGAVGAGLLGKFAYDKLKNGQTDSALTSALPEAHFQYQDPTAGPNAGVDGNLSLPTQRLESDFSQLATPSTGGYQPPNILGQGLNLTGTADGTPAASVVSAADKLKELYPDLYGADMGLF